MKGISKKIAALAMAGVMMAGPMVSAATINVVDENTYIKPDYYWGFGYNYGDTVSFGDNYDEEYDVFVIDQNTKKGSFGKIYQNIGSFMDQEIGMKITVSDWTGANGIVGIGNNEFDDIYAEGELENVTVKVEFFLTDDENMTPIPMKGNVAFYSQQGQTFTVKGDFDETFEEILNSIGHEQVENGTKYTFGAESFGATFDTGLTDNALELTVDLVNMSEGGKYAWIQLHSGMEFGNYINFAEVEKDAVTQGDTLKYNYTMYSSSWDVDALVLAENDKISKEASVLVFPIDQVLEVTNVKLMDRNHNDITEYVDVQIEEDGVIVSTEDDGDYISWIVFAEIDTKVKDFPKLNPEQYVDGKYLLKSSVTSVYEYGYYGAPVNVLSVEDYKEIDSRYGFTVESNVVETELYYRTNVKSLNCDHDGEGVTVATTNNKVTATPKEGYYITKVIIDGEEMDISYLEKGEAFECGFEFINSNHEVYVEAAPIENPDTSDVNVAMQLFTLATSAAGICLTKKRK